MKFLEGLLYKNVRKSNIGKKVCLRVREVRKHVLFPFYYHWVRKKEGNFFIYKLPS